MNKNNRIIINGGHGWLGKAVALQAGKRSIIAAHRDVDFAAQEIEIASDGIVGLEKLKNVASIINCAGKINGQPKDVFEANVTNPINLAKSAKLVGVRSFVQVSSFAIYGKCERIDSNSKEKPIGLYGKTKLQAEQGLLSLADENFSISCVRVPFLFGVENPALMGKLIRIFDSLPLLPAGAGVARSMLTYQDAARALVYYADQHKTGVYAVADPELFTFPGLRSHMLKAKRNPGRIISVPRPISGLLKSAIPVFGRRMFASSVLAKGHNHAFRIPDLTGLAWELERLLECDPVRA